MMNKPKVGKLMCYIDLVLPAQRLVHGRTWSVDVAASRTPEAAENSVGTGNSHCGGIQKITKEVRGT